MPQPMVIVGENTRAAAQSAVRAGYQPVCIDLTACRDLRAIAPVKRADRAGFPRSVLRFADAVPVDAPVLLLAPFDVDPEAARAVAFEHNLAGPSAEAMQSVNDPRALRALPKLQGLSFPEVRTRATLRFRAQRLVFGVFSRRKYLRKPMLGRRGAGIDWWQPSGRLGGDEYLQQHVKGIAMSAIFRGDGWSSVLLGVVEQLVGERWPGATPWQPCGAIGPVQLSEKTRQGLGQLGVVLTQRHDLRGLFAVDLVQDHRGTLWPIEVNPRYTDDVEVLERAMGFAALSGKGPSTGKGRGRSSNRAGLVGVVRLYATQAGRLAPAKAPPINVEHLDQREEGAAIEPGDHVATLRCSGTSRDGIEKALRDAAKAMDPWVVEPTKVTVLDAPHDQLAPSEPGKALPKEPPAAPSPPRPQLPPPKPQQPPRDSQRRLLE